MKNNTKMKKVYNFAYKTLNGANCWLFRFDKINGFIRVYDGVRYLELKNMTPFTTELDIL